MFVYERTRHRCWEVTFGTTMQVNMEQKHNCSETSHQMMKTLLAPHLLTLGLKHFLLMLLWQRCLRTTRFPGSLLEKSMPVQHMFNRILGGGM